MRPNQAQQKAELIKSYVLTLDKAIDFASNFLEEEFETDIETLINIRDAAQNIRWNLENPNVGD